LHVLRAKLVVWLGCARSMQMCMHQLLYAAHARRELVIGVAGRDATCSTYHIHQVANLATVCERGAGRTRAELKSGS